MLAWLLALAGTALLPAILFAPSSSSSLHPPLRDEETDVMKMLISLWTEHTHLPHEARTFFLSVRPPPAPAPSPGL